MARLVCSALIATSLMPLLCYGRRALVAHTLDANSSVADATDSSSASSNVTSRVMPNLPHPYLDGNCAIHDVDNWKPQTNDSCYVYVYRCSNSVRQELANHNFGDVGWALSGECHEYGKYLHIAKIEFARVWMLEQPCWDDGMLDFCNGGYTMCNRGPWGSACGCGLHGDKCGPDADKRRLSANNFGWRRVPDWLFHNIPAKHQDLSTCPCNHYSLPYRAKGRVDGPRTKKFLDEAGYDDRSRDAYFQWDFAGYAHVVDIERCLGRHVLREDWSIEQKVAAFKTAVLDRKEHDCRHH